MPLLNGDLFEPHKLPDDLPDDALVYYNAHTGEAFEDYESYMQWQTLYSSQVWTCEVTGRSGLTFYEAVESTREAASALDSICPSLQRAIMYIIYSNADKLGSMDMGSPLLQYVQNRFFLGEDVVVIEHAKLDGKVVGVIPPTEEEILNADYHAEGFRSVQFGVDSTLYKYEIRLNGDEDAEPREVDAFHVTRPKDSITKDKLRLFLKTTGVCCRRGQVVIPEDILEKFDLSNLEWTDVFEGPEPDFTEPTKIIRGHCKAKVTPLPITREPKELKLKITPEEREKMRAEAREKRNEQKRLARLKIKEEREAKMAAINEWKRKKDDLICDDLIPIPTPIPVCSKIPPQHFGSALAIMEFLNLYNPLLEIKEFFPDGITLPILEGVLLSESITGPFCDVMKVLLTTNLALMDEDEKYFLAANATTAGVQESKDGDDDEEEKKDESVELARKWWSAIKETHGVTLKEISVDQYTLTEMVRLHVLTAGAHPKQRCVQRGWYDPWEDPLLILKKQQPDIVEDLESKTIFQLSLNQRIDLMHAFINQMLAFITTRDNIEVNFQELMRIKKELREKTMAAKKEKIQSQSSGPDSQSQETENLKEKPDHTETILLEPEEYAQLRHFQAAYNGKSIGRDRAYRRYYLLYSLGVLLVDHSDIVGHCLEPTEIMPRPPDPSTLDTPNDAEEFNKDDENADNSEIKAQPDVEEKKPELKVHPGLGSWDRCTFDIETCPVHGEYKMNERNQWAFYHTEQQIDNLIESLNLRGFRESAMHEYLTTHKEDILIKLANCKPADLTCLNIDFKPISDDKENDKKMTNGIDSKESILNEIPIQQVFQLELISRLNLTDKTDCKISDFAEHLLSVATKSVVTEPLASHLGRWEDSVKKSTNLSQLHLHFTTLDRNIPLEKSGKRRIRKPEDDRLASRKVRIVSTINFKMCDDLIKSLQRCEHSWPFRKKPAERDAPNYFNCIKRHVDLGILVSRLNDGTYRSNQDCLRDILVMFTNNELYWPSDSLPAVAGRKLRAYLDKMLEDKRISLLV